VAIEVITGATVSSTKTATSGEQEKSDLFVFSSRTSWTDGTGAASVNKHYASGSATLATGTVQAYDLSGALANGIGESAVFGTVQIFALTTGTANATTINLYGQTPFLTGTLTLPPYTRIVIENLSGTAWPIRNGTNDTMNLSGTTGATYSLYVAGQ
jgi:hypothetical protein